eukprot:gene12578-14544_t
MRPFQQVGAFRQTLQGRGLNFRRTALRTFARKSAAERNAASKASSISELSNKSFKATADNNRGENNAANRAEAESDLQNFMQQAFAEAELVTVTNSQKAIPIDTDEVTRQAKLLLEILNVRDFELDILFCTEAKIRSLNQEWREKSESTDVLSFPTHNFVAPEKFDAEAKRMFRFQKHLGELMIAP